MKKFIIFVILLNSLPLPAFGSNLQSDIFTLHFERWQQLSATQNANPQAFDGSFENHIQHLDAHVSLTTYCHAAQFGAYLCPVFGSLLIGAKELTDKNADFAEVPLGLYWHKKTTEMEVYSYALAMKNGAAMLGFHLRW